MRKFALTVLLISLFAIQPLAATTVDIEGRHVVKNNAELRTGQHAFLLTGLNGAPMPDNSDGQEKHTKNQLRITQNINSKNGHQIHCQ